MSHGMRPFGALISKEEALARLLAAARPVTRVEELPLAAAVGRVAASDVLSPIDVPPFARATMDGYAVRSVDSGPRRVIGEIAAGSATLPTIALGEAARIATGAPLPHGANAVVRVEDAREDHGVVALERAPVAGQFVDAAGSDIARGGRIVREGARLTPARLGLLASIGASRVAVRARPRVALFSTGDELLRPGEAPAEGRIYDANSTSLAALASRIAEVRMQGALKDEEDAQRTALRAASREHDIIMISGGASVGKKDHAARAVAAEGEVLFHGVRVKPGKPLLAGRIGESLVVGLPGNPTSALSNAHLFVLPVLRAIAGLPEAARGAVPAHIVVDVKGEADRFLFLPVRLDAGRAIPTFKGSGALTSLAESDGWIGVPEGASLAAGSAVDVHPW